MDGCNEIWSNTWKFNIIKYLEEKRISMTSHYVKDMIHLKQPDNKSCTSTCIAMLTGLKVSKVKKEFHDKYMSGKITAQSYLDSLGLLTRSALSTDRFLVRGCRYILCVPSLNLDGMFHNIVVDASTEPVTVYDPQKGNDVNFYNKWGDIKGYCIDVEIFPTEEVLTAYENPTKSKEIG